MNKKLSVFAIGTGGAFDTDKVNSSFYVKFKNDKILVDCGYNVFPYIKENMPEVLEELNAVFITHLDDDHIGSLKSLLFYRYYILGKSTLIRCGEDITRALIDYLPSNNVMKNGKYVKINIWSLIDLPNFNPDTLKASGNLPNSFIYPVKCVHHVPSYGFVFGFKDGGMIYISGDTKAAISIEETINLIDNVYNIKESFLLHDFTYHNVPEETSHACQKDIEVRYSTRFIERLNYYHNDKCVLNGLIYELKEK